MTLLGLLAGLVLLMKLGSEPLADALAQGLLDEFAGRDDRISVALLGDLLPFLFKLVTSCVHRSTLLIELACQPFLRCDHFNSCLCIALDELLGGLCQLLALLDDGLRLPGHRFVLFGLLFGNLLSEVGQALIAHVRCGTASDRGQ